MTKTKKETKNRFEDFYAESKYLDLKNYLYNYRLRKKAIEQSFEGEQIELIAEVGSGVSPVMTQTDRIVYSELSFSALKSLKDSCGKGYYVVADATKLPFKDGSFSHTISSEVLEHLPDDKAALGELNRTTKKSGKCIITFPHRKYYFGKDDRFVKHFRRYELDEMAQKLKGAGFEILQIKKVLGLLDKLAMVTAVTCFSGLKKLQKKPRATSRKLPAWSVSLFKAVNTLYMGLAWLEAKLLPRKLATILLIKANKK